MGGRSMGVVTVAILKAIRDGHRYGADIMDATGRSGGTVYKVLRRLEGRGHIRGRWEDPALAERERRPRRRYYRLTPEGEGSLVEALRDMRALLDPSPLPGPSLASEGREP